jgi:cytochrome b involved in lipid metabolism
VAVRRFIFAVFTAFLASAATIGILAKLAPRVEKPAGATARQVSPAELRRHATATDCWMAIEGGVYDFTGYISAHPTAPEVLAEWCGKEATEPFNTKGYGSPHSAAARAMLPRYFVGALGEK